MKDTQPFDLDVILTELGSFGRYQICVFSYLAFIVISKAVNGCQYVFNAGSVKYRCRVPECETSPPNFVADGWDKFALPASESDCNRRVPIGTQCVPASFSNKTLRCTSWIYQNDLTIVPEFDLACHEWKRTLVGTIHGAGVFVALPITAWISDTYGRRVALIGTAVAPAIFGVVRAFSTHYIMYMVLEFFEALVGAGSYSTAFILALEMVEIKMRVLGGNIMSSTFAVGQMIAALVAWAFPYWRTYTLVTYAPPFLFIFYCFFVQESVRWLLSKGRKPEAIKIIKKAVRWNKTKLSRKARIMLTDDSPEAETKLTQTEKLVHGTTPPPKEPSILRQVLRSKKMLFRLCVCSFWWVTVTMIYYGLSINSVALAGSMYVNFILTSIVEIPGCILSAITLNRFGRKSSIITAFFLCGLSLLCLPFIESPTVIIVLTLCGKMMISMIFCSIYIYTIELFPTKARHSMMGICSMTGRIGSMSAPQTPLLMRYKIWLPYVLFGAMAGTAGLLMLLTPETLGIKLPDTIEQAEQMNLAPHTSKKTDVIVN